MPSPGQPIPKKKAWKLPTVRRQNPPLEGRYLVTFPRSGHHLLEGWIEEAFALHGLPYSYCEFYNCCRSSPCKHRKTLQGTHDFDLNLDIPPGRAVVLYRRDPVLQIDAWFRWVTGSKSGQYNHLVEQDSEWWKGEAYEAHLSRFMARRGQHYLRFVERWVESPAEEVISFDYFEMVASPRPTLARVLAHLFSEIPFRGDLLDSIDMTHVRVINRMPEDVYERLSIAWSSLR